MIEQSFTEGARRAIELAQKLASDWGDREVQPGHLLWALMSEESHAFDLLSRHGLSLVTVTVKSILSRSATNDLAPIDDSTPTDEIVDRLSREMRQLFGQADEPIANSTSSTKTCSSQAAEANAWREILLVARKRAKSDSQSNEVATEHLLAALISVPSLAQQRIAQSGLNDSFLPQVNAQELLADPVDAPFEIRWRDPRESDRNNTFRILDAAANRAREGIRVVEDFVRFTLDDAFLSRRLKELRHSLSVALRGLDESALISSRDTVGDVGTTIHTNSEMSRVSLLDVARANLKRIEEATRTLEEFSKVAVAFDPSATHLRNLPTQLGQVRYDLYTLEKAILTSFDSCRRLEGASLYLLLTQSLCRQAWDVVLRQAIAGGVRVVQIREKQMNDRDLLAHARRVREITAESNALLIINDRPDLAVLCEADGVHVGQEELSVRDARRIVGPDRLVGVSTHSIEQARQAVLDGASYLGVGPTFQSGTKSFSEFAGLDYVRNVAQEISLPWYAIGGIDETNVSQVVRAGAGRVAVTGAICRAESPQAIAAELSHLLTT